MIRRMVYQANNEDSQVNCTSHLGAMIWIMRMTKIYRASDRLCISKEGKNLYTFSESSIINGLGEADACQGWHG